MNEWKRQIDLHYLYKIKGFLCMLYGVHIMDIKLPDYNMTLHLVYYETLFTYLATISFSFRDAAPTLLVAVATAIK